MSAPLVVSQVMVLPLRHYQHLTVGVVAAPHRLWCSGATNPESELGRSDELFRAICNSRLYQLRAKDPLSYSRWDRDDPDYRKWKDKENEILEDIEPILMLTKDILHSPRYKDGERLTVEDEKAVVDNLLAYHPHSEDKIGCGIESIMVDRHPQFQQSRCLFVVRSDGGWIDFSYQKCLREYIRDKYPSHAERFIREHFKRGSG